MKKYICVVSIIFAFLSLSCGVSIFSDQSYTPPVQKNHPRLLYPKIALEKQYYGKTKVAFAISEAGTIDRVDVIESSGFTVLDEAAIQYCKELVYSPAIRNDEPVPARLLMDIKFDLSNPLMDAKKYVSEVNDLYSKLEKANLTERNKIQKEILQMHNEFVSQMQDPLNFNIYVGQVIRPELLTEWKKDWNAWPLSFLLYHDFIKRFPDYDDISTVKILLNTSVKEDLRFINNTYVNGLVEEEKKENIMMKIEGFIANQYPDIVSHKAI